MRIVSRLFDRQAVIFRSDSKICFAKILTCDLVFSSQRLKQTKSFDLKAVDDYYSDLLKQVTNRDI